VLRDLILAQRIYQQIDATRQPVNPAVLEFAGQQIQTPAALDAIKNLNGKYLAIQQRDISKSQSLKSADDVADMSDGEKILRKIIEPYRGKLILLDVWGTWCSPCKEALSHSAEEYERLKDFDIVFLYLANRSDDASWKNVIKEYNLVGDNVVHYNLPRDQQSAVEHFLNVSGFPTYKLIDRDGTILDVNADPRNLERLAGMLEQMK
jgi:thiol-disulfide isomerase/thioredoxin